MSSATTKKVVSSQQKKDDCNAKAQRIVLELITAVTNEDNFLQQLRWINQTHYQDITEERSIMKMCGYPLCDKTLGEIPKKKYHISLSQNKVYDITERKLFCSNQCYKASTYLKTQLYTSPLWSRDQEDIIQFTLLKTQNELIGEEVNFGLQKIKSALENEMPENKLDVFHQKNVLDNSSTEQSVEGFVIRHSAEVSLETDRNSGKMEFDASNCSAELRISNQNDSAVTFPETTDSESTKWITGSIMKIEIKKPIQPGRNTVLNSMGNSKSKELPANNVSNVKNTPDKNSILQPKEINHNESESAKNPIKKAEQSLQEWMSLDTLCFIMGNEILAKFDTTRMKSDPSLYERYKAICKSLKIFDLQEVSNNINLEIPTETLPDFNLLRQQVTEMEIKVKSFYRGDTKVSFASLENEEDTSERPCNFLPPLHQHAHNSIRRTIVLDKLKLTLPDICNMLDLDFTDVFSNVKKLVFTFKLSAHNITFKPVAWNLIGLATLKLLSMNNDDIKRSFTNKPEFVNAILKRYKLENNYLDLLCSSITDLETVLKNEEN